MKPTTASNKYLSELSFLNAFDRNSQNRFEDATWLKCDFAENTWNCVFSEDCKMTIYFDVRLYNGTYLTAKDNLQLLNTIKKWICIQTHQSATGGRFLSPSVSRRRIRNTIHLIDYFLIHGKDFELCKFGFSTLTESDLIRLFVAIQKTPFVSISIYEWPSKLENFLKDKISKNPKTCIVSEEIYGAIPKIKLTKLTDNEIHLARYWLKVNGYYKCKIRGGHSLNPDLRRIAKEIYSNTLRGGSIQSAPELQLNPIEELDREFYPAPTRTGTGESHDKNSLSNYVNCMENLALIADDSNLISENSLSALQRISRKLRGEIKGPGRTKTLPVALVLDAIKNSIEFFEKHGDQIIDSYLLLLKTASKNGESISTYLQNNKISNLLSDKSSHQNISLWNHSAYRKTLSKEKYFDKLREKPSLRYLMRVLFGSIQIAMGALTARRDSEIRGLIAGECLDKTKTRLIFKNCKSGFMGEREIEARPIPNVLARMIELLERLQTELINQGVQKKRTYLFSFPSIGGNGIKLTKSYDCHSRSFDAFCDYFQTPLNDAGQRYYIRSHQLRRFFAMLFFWGNSFGGLDTLRWFLGHTDIEHLYHYVTETIEGEVLTTLKAQYGRELITGNSHTSNELAKLVEEKFGTKNFSILDDEELDEYIGWLITEGKLTIEPEFFTTTDGRSYRIAIKVVKE